MYEMALVEESPEYSLFLTFPMLMITICQAIEVNKQLLENHYYYYYTTDYSQI